jgi:hypothetical protein
MLLDSDDQGFHQTRTELTAHVESAHAMNKLQRSRNAFERRA